MATDHFNSPRVVGERRDLTARQSQLLVLSQAFNSFNASDKPFKKFARSVSVVVDQPFSRQYYDLKFHIAATLRVELRQYESFGEWALGRVGTCISRWKVVVVLFPLYGGHFLAEQQATLHSD